MKGIKVKIDLRNGSSNIVRVTMECLKELLSLIGTKKGNKVWKGWNYQQFVFAIVPNDIVAINNYDTLEK